MEKLADVRKRMGSVKGIGEVCRTLGDGRLGEAGAHARARARRAALHRAAARDARAAAGGGARRGRDPAALSPLMGVRPQVRPHRASWSSAPTAGCAAATTSRSAERRADSRERRPPRAIAVSAIVKGRRAETYLRRATDVPIGEASGWTRAGVTGEEVDVLLDVDDRAVPRG